MSGFTVIDHSGEVLREFARRAEIALDTCGGQAESYAKKTIDAAGRVDTSDMLNSVSHRVQDQEVYVGTNISYAIYHEFGTGIYTTGGGGRKSPWAYKDAKGEWHRTVGIAPIHFLKNAVADHVSEYKQIFNKIMRGR